MKLNPRPINTNNVQPLSVINGALEKLRVLTN
jgi:hypothetical protein